MTTTQSDTRSDAATVVFWRNRLTFAGAILAYASILFLGCFFLIGLITPVHNPYVGVWFYLVLPGVLAAGLLLMPLGTLIEWRRQRRLARARGESGKGIHLDMNLPHHRKVVRFIVLTTVFVVPAVATTTYHGYHYTDSTEFCAKVCHTVMEPQYVAQQRSPHARVGCVECHIGSGAEWYVKSKLSGARQVLAVARNSYHRPIPPAITELRPAVDTCQECHWPEKFYGDQLLRIAHYAPDEGNTPQHIEMIVKTGGGDPKHGPAAGIHWHMALSNRIEYVATDEELQHIVWVRQTTADGRTVIYRNDGLSSADPKPAGIERTLDCMDCHNRAAHDFRPPLVALDLALDAEGMLDRALPYIKREAAAAIAAARLRPDDGPAVIDRHLRDFYQQNYPRVARDMAASIRVAVEIVQDIYRSTFFNYMKVDWRSYPNNIGHKYFPGCFRCHNGDMVADSGESIQRTCAACHVFLEVQSADPETSLIRAGKFTHPVPLAGTHATTLCSNCHNGGTPPPPTCAGCHETESALAAGTLELPAPFSMTAGTPEVQQAGPRAGPLAGPLAGHSCEACHNLAKPTNVETIAAQCTTCHAAVDANQTAAGHADRLRTWHADVTAARERASEAVSRLAHDGPESGDGSSAEVRVLQGALDVLDVCTAIHNPEAAIAAYESIAAKAASISDNVTQTGGAP